MPWAIRAWPQRDRNTAQTGRSAVFQPLCDELTGAVQDQPLGPWFGWDGLLAGGQDARYATASRQRPFSMGRLP